MNVISGPLAICISLLLADGCEYLPSPKGSWAVLLAETRHSRNSILNAKGLPPNLRHDQLRPRLFRLREVGISIFAALA